MHSTVSDGSFSVAELVEMVAAAGVSVFALTDHDSVDGLATAQAEAQRHGLRLIHGVELSTRHDNLELHILGYGFDPAHPLLTEKLSAQKAARHGRLPALVARLNQLGLTITLDDVYRAAGDSNPGRPHVARALIALGHVRDTDEAFRRFLGDAAPANVRKPVPSPAEAISWIHAAGGTAVWAHPLARQIHRRGGFEALARELLSAGLDGLEEIHPAHDPSARRRVRQLARELGLKLSGGSDFHGEATRGVAIGVGRGSDHIDASLVDTLLS